MTFRYHSSPPFKIKEINKQKLERETFIGKQEVHESFLYKHLYILIYRNMSS